MTDEPLRYFTLKFKSRNRLAASALLVLAAVAPFGIGLVLITLALPEPTGPFAAIITALAFMASGLLTWVMQDRVALLGNGWLRRRVRAAVCAQDATADLEATLFVGFSPGAEVRSWEGETDLDVGYLRITPEALVFHGDAYTWSLARDRVDNIDLTPAQMGPRRIVMNWHEAREAARALTLESRDADSLRQTNELTSTLFLTLREWSSRPAPETAEATAFLGFPPTDLAGARPIDELASGSCLTTAAMAVIIIIAIWQMASYLLAEGLVYHAALAAGLVFVGGAVLTRCILHYLQSTAPPPSRGTAAPSSRRP